MISPQRNQIDNYAQQCLQHNHLANHVQKSMHLGYCQRLWILGILSLLILSSYQSTIFLNRHVPWKSFDLATNISNESQVLLEEDDMDMAPLTPPTTATATPTGTQFGPIGALRWNWTHLTVQSPLAKEFASHQSNCDLPLHYFRSRNKAGLGSELHGYGMALCNAHRRKKRMFTAKHWMYISQQDCAGTTSMSAMACYFPKLELQCPGDELQAQLVLNASQAMKKRNRNLNKLTWRSQQDVQCQSILQQPGYSSLFNIMDVRAAITELQFSQLSQIVVQEAQRQHALVFPKGAPPPYQLITVHVRWGDKGKEMKLQPIEKYIEAIEQVAQHRKMLPNEVHIFLSTEDPRALQQFMAQAPSPWNVHVDQFMYEMLPYRNNQTQQVAGTAKDGQDKIGLWALGSLLVAMEADSYVLTTESNWSRLMNEMRKAIVRTRHCPAPHHYTKTNYELPQHHRNSSHVLHYNNSTAKADCTTFLDVSGVELFG